MFKWFWSWLHGSHVHNALRDYENAKLKLEAAVSKEALILDKEINKRQIAVSMTTDIQASLRSEFERQMAAEAERHAAQLGKVEAKIADKNDAVNTGATLLAQLKALS